MSVSAPSPAVAHLAGQASVIAFLSSAATYGVGPTKVERIETHGALVFLAGGDVYKIKRAVAYPYMDFSTLELRHAALARELEVNQPHAPDIYLGLVPVTREGDGSLALAGRGPLVEWALHMRRFPQTDLLSSIANARGIDAPLARRLADAVCACHRSCAVHKLPDAAGAMEDVIGGLVDGLASSRDLFDPAAVERFAANCRSRLASVAGLLRRRASAGHVRRCHGDLHLSNIVQWRGEPTLFDAIEFDETLAIIDTLYDLAFLLMDLERRGQRVAANIVLNRYLWRSQDPLDLEGLAALPLFLALRAGIRAMVTAERAELMAEAAADVGSPASTRPTKSTTSAVAYFDAALAYLAPAAPCVVAVGGMSGTGKSTLAARLAPTLGAAPGALHLRSDLERKALSGIGETDRLPPESYTAESSRRVYAALMEKARMTLAAGHAVVVDAALLADDERRQIEAVAAEQRVPFAGLWLQAREDVLVSRVAARVGDASDATPDVVHKQAAWSSGPGNWIAIDAGGSAAETLNAALSALDQRFSERAVPKQ